MSLLRPRVSTMSMSSAPPHPGVESAAPRFESAAELTADPVADDASSASSSSDEEAYDPRPARPARLLKWLKPWRPAERAALLRFERASRKAILITLNVDGLEDLLLKVFGSAVSDPGQARLIATARKRFYEKTVRWKFETMKNLKDWVERRIKRDKGLAGSIDEGDVAERFEKLWSIRVFKSIFRFTKGIDLERSTEEVKEWCFSIFVTLATAVKLHITADKYSWKFCLNSWERFSRLEKYAHLRVRDIDEVREVR